MPGAGSDPRCCRRLVPSLQETSLEDGEHRWHGGVLPQAACAHLLVLIAIGTVMTGQWHVAW